MPSADLCRSLRDLSLCHDCHHRFFLGTNRLRPAELSIEPSSDLSGNSTSQDASHHQYYETCLVGDSGIPNKPSFATVTGKGDNPSFTC